LARGDRGRFSSEKIPQNTFNTLLPARFPQNSVGTLFPLKTLDSNTDGMKNMKNKSKLKSVRKFFRNNRGVFFTLGGIAAGLAIVRFLGSERAAETLKTVGNNVKAFGHKVASGVQNQTHEPAISQRRL
jgi:hypothetical protein